MNFLKAVKHFKPRGLKAFKKFVHTFLLLTHVGCFKHGEKLIKTQAGRYSYVHRRRSTAHPPHRPGTSKH